MVSICSQSYLSSTITFHFTNYQKTGDFDYNNFSRSVALVYRFEPDNAKFSFYSGFRYYSEKTKTNCISFIRNSDLPISSYFLDNLNCEYKRYINIENLSLQLAGGYRILAQRNIKFSVFFENNSIIYESINEVYGSTPNSPNIIDSGPFIKYFESWLESYIIPTLSYSMGLFNTDLGLSYGVRDFNFDKTLLGLRISIGFKF